MHEGYARPPYNRLISSYVQIIAGKYSRIHEETGYVQPRSLSEAVQGNEF